jgi:type IV secretion system protein TrbJ
MKGDRTMKKIKFQKHILLSMLLASFFLCSNTLYAQFAVFDPVNLIQNILSVLKQAEANIQLATQIENDIKALKLIGTSEFSAINSLLKKDIDDLNQLIVSVKGISYTMDNINTQYDAIFPDNDGWDAATLSNYPAYARDWNNKTTSSIKDAMRAQSILSGIIDTNNNVMSILSDVSGSDGQVRQLQASNQILAQMSSQLGDITQSLAVTSRMTATALAADESRKAASRQVIDNSLETFDKKDTTKPPYETLPKLDD